VPVPRLLSFYAQQHSFCAFSAGLPWPIRPASCLTCYVNVQFDPALQRHFHYDPAVAAAEEKQQTDNTENRSQATDNNQPSSVAGIKAEMDDAISQVKEIVNQPVTAVPRTPDMQVSMYPRLVRPRSRRA
jgi:hypothetical protein